MLVLHSFMVQDSKVSFEYVDFYTKMSLILDAAFGNQKTKWTLLYIYFSHNISRYRLKLGFIFTCFFMYSRAVEGHASLLFAHKTDIRKIALDHHNSMVSIVNETRSSCAIDFNFRTGMIYWSDVMTQKIYKWVSLHNFLISET